MTTSVLIPSYNRPGSLVRCLHSLGGQSRMPDDVIVIWQGEDTATRDAAELEQARFPCELKLVHSPIRGVVPAENAGLAVAAGEVVLLIDDDAIAPKDWLARHLRWYADPSIGAVGGPAINHCPDGTPFPTRSVEPIGRLSWWGKTHGNMFDHPDAWIQRRAVDVDHVVGYNLSIRRTAFSVFAEALREYWQLFELEVCLQVKARGFRVLFDFANVVDHFPTNTAYAEGRDGDLQVKAYHPAYNHAWILSRHTSSAVQRWARLSYLLGVGTVGSPGALAALIALRRYGNPRREARILRESLKAKWRGWCDGARARAGGASR